MAANNGTICLNGVPIDFERHDKVLTAADYQAYETHRSHTLGGGAIHTCGKLMHNTPRNLKHQGARTDGVRHK